MTCNLCNVCINADGHVIVMISTDLTKSSERKNSANNMDCFYAIG